MSNPQGLEIAPNTCAAGGLAFCPIPREAKVEKLTIDSTEYQFKMALAQQCAPLPHRHPLGK